MYLTCFFLVFDSYTVNIFSFWRRTPRVFQREIASNFAGGLDFELSTTKWTMKLDVRQSCAVLMMGSQTGRHALPDSGGAVAAEALKASKAEPLTCLVFSPQQNSEVMRPYLQPAFDVDPSSVPDLHAMSLLSMLLPTDELWIPLKGFGSAHASSGAFLLHFSPTGRLSRVKHGP